jgi:hypothetical protein
LRVVAHAHAAVQTEALGTPEQVRSQANVGQGDGQRRSPQKFGGRAVAPSVVRKLGRVIRLRESDNLFGVGKEFLTGTVFVIHLLVPFPFEAVPPGVVSNKDIAQ